jgi:hypothetical protein
MTKLQRIEAARKAANGKWRKYYLAHPEKKRKPAKRKKRES